jgi:glucan phosphoethanolaminetransferase (alkaline phosphatase superfamily)
MALVLALPACLVVLTDFALRGDRLLALPPKYMGSYAFAVLESGVLWGVLLASASARRGWLRWLGAALFVSLATMVVGTQLYFYESYASYLNLDATLFGTSMRQSLFGQLGADLRHLAASFVPPLGVALGLVWLGRRLVRTPRNSTRWASMLTPAVVLSALLIPCSYRSVQASTPDVIYLHAMGGLLKQLSGIEEQRQIRPMRRTPPALPALDAEPPAQRNVIFVLTESVRADLGCPAHRPSCPVMPFSNEAAPERMPLFQMRSNSSTTAIQLAVLWSGLGPNAGRQALHTAPLLFDYAYAAGYETAYWSSHHMWFANSRFYVQDLPTRFQCGATNLDPLADIDLGADDRLLTKRVKEQLPELREPFFAVVQFGNTHIPYLIDESDAPFEPYLASKAGDDNEIYRNYYKNAVHRQDQTVGELLRFIRELPSSERTVIIYTSDHGEQFREHGQLGHTGSVFDVEIHVPTWIDAPDGTLTDAEREALASYASEPTFHTDVTPTVLDLLGLWETSELSRYRQEMVGSSLLRPDRPQQTVALTNCSGVWGCVFENFGVMRGTRKLLAREWDQQWLCYDVSSDREELEPLPLTECSDLVTEAERIYPSLPGKGD